MMLESEVVWRAATAELLRAVRGKRSQVAFSRRLGFQSNVAAEWEGGRRAPTAERLVRAMIRVGMDVDSGFARFHPTAAPARTEGLHAWLRAIAGNTRQSQVATRSGFSRHQIRRWFSGESEPRVHEFLRVVHALTGRAPDWVACLVPIERVPSLESAHRAAQAAARLAYDHPWTTAVRLLLVTDGYRDDPTEAFLARALGLDLSDVRAAVQALLDAGLVVRDGEGLAVSSTFSSTVSASVDDIRKLKAHWARVASERLHAPRSLDLTSVNLITVSRADLERVRQLQRDYFRALRGLVASSHPEEVAAFVMMQTVSLSPESP
ncbi:MAG: DUF4423 domain-containing protein [Myxococcota bacterium]